MRPSDAFDSIAELQGELDVIMVDLTDPIGPAARLFEDEFYAVCEPSLRDDGFLVAQTESIHFHPEVVRNCFTTLSRRFRVRRSVVDRDRHLPGRVLDVRHRVEAARSAGRAPAPWT